MSKIYPKKEVNMANCKELYLFLFNKITDAVNELESRNYGRVRDILLSAQQEAEEMYLQDK